MRRNLIGSLIVAALVGAIWWGLPAISKSVNPLKPVPADERIPVGGGVSLFPPPGASLDAARTNSLSGVLTLVLDGITYRVVELSTPLTLDKLAEEVRDQIKAQDGFQSLGEEQPIVTTQGWTGRAAPFISTESNGLYAVFVESGTGVVATAEGPPEAMAIHADDLFESIKSIGFSS